MSNPSINRWGLNLFWYRYWFNDKNNALIINQDNIINKLVLIYLHFGILFAKNIFLSKYWYDNDIINNNKNQYNIFNLKYFRLVEYKNKILKEYKLYRLRNKIKNLYHSKIWIMRYQKWFILNFYSFQPLPTKLNKKFIKRKSIDSYLKKKNYNWRYSFYRHKFFLIYFLNNYLKDNNFYEF